MRYRTRAPRSFPTLRAERVLKTAGYEVISATDGERALRLAREQGHALILLDVMLPKISGLDVLKILKNDPCPRRFRW